MFKIKVIKRSLSPYLRGPLHDKYFTIAKGYDERIWQLRYGPYTHMYQANIVDKKGYILNIGGWVHKADIVNNTKEHFEINGWKIVNTLEEAIEDIKRYGYDI